jgi:SAM-dependent methyltransferase
MMATMTEEWRKANRGLWEEMASIHPATAEYDLDGLVAGDDRLRPWEPTEVGPVDGLDLIHLQCHIGTDTIGWARRGARVVGLDFSPIALRAAAELAHRCGLDMAWVESDVYDAVTAVSGRTFDVVYSGVGALNWLPDVARWATVVRGLLRPGGILYLYELHPTWMMLVGDGKTMCQDSIGAPFRRWEDDESTSYADAAPLKHKVSYERAHAIGEILTAVLDAGLTVEVFHEFDVTPSPTPWLESGADGLRRFPDGAFRFPLSYSLRARAPT